MKDAVSIILVLALCVLLLGPALRYRFEKQERKEKLKQAKRDAKNPKE